MNKELKIEHYLLQLDRALQPLTVSQRAEIITEIKSHILGALERDPRTEVDTILASLGTPVQVAEPYLTSKGIAILQPKRSGSWMKWLAIMTVAFFIFVFLSGLSVIWYLSPLIRVDQEAGRVTLFGGMIDVNEKLGKLRVGGIEMNDALKEGVRIFGEEDFATEKITKVKIPFNTAKLEITPASDRVMRWECRAAGNASPKTDVVAGVMTLNLDSLNLAKCSISIPRGAASEFLGVNGHMDVQSPSGALNISLTNGKVNIRPDPSRVYDFEVKVKNGLQDFFPRSSAKEALKIKVDVVNGLVNKE